MALDNKVGGEKLYAFEINNLHKAIRQLSENVATLNARGVHWQYISTDTSLSVSGDGTTDSDTTTIPVGCTHMVCDITMNFVTGESVKQQLILDITNHTTATWRTTDIDTAGVDIQTVMSISGDVLTMTYTQGGSNDYSASATIYFYT